MARRGRRGPWPTYCSPRCRRSIEYERERLRRRVRRGERELVRRLELDCANRGLLSTLRGLDGSTWAGDTQAIRFEIAALHRRLHVLRTLHPRAAACGRKEIDR
ncbi:MAG: hypothetical protein K8T90_21935 [Planctomycetes bacterium]|nr:hypothetical protein [Planctomycetota bacterium]